MNKSTIEIAMNFAMRISKYTFKENMIDDFISFEDHVIDVLKKVIDLITSFPPTLEEIMERLNQKESDNTIKPEDKI